MTIGATWLKRPSKLSRITLLASSVGGPPLSPSTSSANFYLRWNGNSSSFVSPASSKSVSLCTHIRPPRLQQTSIHPNWHGGTCPRQTSLALHRHISGPLLMMEILVNNDVHHLNFGRSIFQAQVPLQPDGNPQRSSHRCGCQPCQSP